MRISTNNIKECKFAVLIAAIVCFSFFNCSFGIAKEVYKVDKKIKYNLCFLPFYPFVPYCIAFL